MERTALTKWTVVLFDGEEAYTEHFIAGTDNKGAKKVREYCDTTGMRVLLMECTQHLTKDELTEELKDSCLRDRYFNMYCC